jgi:uncharacterized delta-60 repeat protein
LDPSFASVGVLTAQFANATFYAPRIAIQTDGKFLVSGASTSGTLSTYSLVRYHPDGRLDQQFGANGMATASPGPNGGEIAGIASRPDGKIVVVGQSHNGSNYDIDLLRFEANGSLDTAWGNPGQLLSTVGSSEIAYGLALQADGKVVIAGASYSGGESVFLVARVNEDGTLDDTFGTQGIVNTPILQGYAQAVYSQAEHVAIQDDGKILVAGNVYLSFQNRGEDHAALVRYHSDGSLDASFGMGGLVTDSYGRLTGFLLQRDGKICRAIYQPQGLVYMEMARYTAAGLPDQSFGQDGRIDISPIIIYDIIEDGHGRLITTSESWSNNMVEITRYQQDGTIDLSFGTSGRTAISLLRYGSRGSLATQSNGKIVMAGSSVNPVGGNLVVLQFVP